MREQEGSDKLILYVTFADKIFESLASYINGCRPFGIKLPVFCMLTLIEVNGYRMPMQGWQYRLRQPSLIDREILLLPDAIIKDYDTPPDVIL
ncbi:MAG: hypothetical protein IIA61_02480 [Candidatus Marinimicrobia bacterium]|nr:hypothetical protein [Candidatus Neomarinimicrobiota bacterium]